MDEVEIFWVLWIAVIGSPGASYRILIELQHGVIC